MCLNIRCDRVKNFGGTRQSRYSQDQRQMNDERRVYACAVQACINFADLLCSLGSFQLCFDWLIILYVLLMGFGSGLVF
jgi:hypothetical protein